MNCIIPAQNIRILSKAVNALAKVGDEIYLEADEEKLIFTTLNMSKTVCSQCSFLRSFFSSYIVNKGASSETTNETIICKLFMKSVLPLFKGNLEKKLEFLKVEFDNDSDFIFFKMKYKYDQIMMIHKLRLMDSEKLCFGITPNSGMNNIVGTSALFTQFLSMFNLSDSEITLEVMNSRLIARNYYSGSASNPKLMRVEVNWSAREFLIFDVKDNTSINFAVKPLRTVISFAENLSLQIGVNFDTGGKPLTLLMKHPTFNIHFIVSTLNPNRDLQSSMASTSLPLSTQKNVNVVMADQEKRENHLDIQPNTHNSFTSILNRANSSYCNLNDNPPAAQLAAPTEERSFHSNAAFYTDTNDDDHCEDQNVFSQSSGYLRNKKMKLIFSRCYEPTIVVPDLGREYIGNSDSE